MHKLRDIPWSLWVAFYLLSLCFCYRFARLNGVNAGIKTARTTINDLIKCNDKLSLDYWEARQELDAREALLRFALRNGKGVK